MIRGSDSRKLISAKKFKLDDQENGIIQYFSNEEEGAFIEYEEEEEKIMKVSQNAFLLKSDVDKIQMDKEGWRCSNRVCKKKNVAFTTSMELEIHNSEIHLDQFTKNVCPICNKVLVNQFKLATHMELRHTPKLFLCDHCPKVFRSKDNLRLHMTHHRVHFYVECRACKKGYKSIQSLRYHLRQHFEHHQCETCGAVFEHKKLLLGHIAAKHNQSLQVQCNYCSRLFARSDVRDAHEKEIHKNGKVISHFKCNECNLTFDLREDLMSHKILNHFNGVIHTCEECGKNFKKKSLLDLHMHVHRQKSYSCDVCKMFFTFVTGLNKHKKLGRCKGPPELTLKDKLGKEEIARIAKQQLYDITVNPKKNLIEENLEENDDHDENLDADLKFPKRDLPVKKSINITRKLPVKEEEEVILDSEPTTHKKSIIVRQLTTTEIQAQQNNQAVMMTSSSGRIIKKKMPLVVTTTTYSPTASSLRSSSGVQKNFTCDFCSVKMNTKNALHLHLQEHIHLHGTEHRCLHCEEIFPTTIGLKQHYSLKHSTREEESTKDKKFKCEKCNRKYHTQHLLSMHQKSHENLKEYKCTSCTFATNTPYDLNNHIKRMHNPVRPFECPTCLKSFKRRCDVQNHCESVHSELKTYVKCPVCETIVLEKGLHSHILNRHSEKGMSRPFVCKICGKAERYEKNLKRHYDSVHEPKDRGIIYTCPDCDEKFYRRRDLTAHSFVHFKGVVHICLTCGNKYKTKKELTNHEYSHRSVEFPCPICKQVFQTKSGRSKHIKKHKLTEDEMMQLLPNEPSFKKEIDEEDKTLILAHDSISMDGDEIYEEYEVLEEVEFIDIE